jgi:hypothetical protein
MAPTKEASRSLKSVPIDEKRYALSHFLDTQSLSSRLRGDMLLLKTLIERDEESVFGFPCHSSHSKLLK